MRYHIISIFPELFNSFLETSLLAKAQEKWIIDFHLVNPRDFCTDKHKQIDDEPYGGGAGMLMKAQPIIDAIKSLQLQAAGAKLLLLAPSRLEFTQQLAHEYCEVQDIVLICGRYEGIDHRVELRCQQEFGDSFSKISLGKFVTLGGEVPAMTIIEATARLIPGVIKEELSRQDESYRPEHWWENIEYPQYTRPESVEWFSVPEVLLSWHHAEIATWRRVQWLDN